MSQDQTPPEAAEAGLESASPADAPIGASAGPVGTPEATSDLTPEAAAGAKDLLRDIELEATLRFGSREMTLGEVLELGPGDVIELDRQVNDAVDLLVGDKIVARGVAVLCNGRYGLRVTEVAELKLALESVRCLF